MSPRAPGIQDRIRLLASEATNKPISKANLEFPPKNRVRFVEGIRKELEAYQLKAISPSPARFLELLDGSLKVQYIIGVHKMMSDPVLLKPILQKPGSLVTVSYRLLNQRRLFPLVSLYQQARHMIKRQPRNKYIHIFFHDLGAVMQDRDILPRVSLHEFGSLATIGASLGFLDPAKAIAYGPHKSLLKGRFWGEIALCALRQGDLEFWKYISNEVVRQNDPGFEEFYPELMMTASERNYAHILESYLHKPYDFSPNDIGQAFQRSVVRQNWECIEVFFKILFDQVEEASHLVPDTYYFDAFRVSVMHSDFRTLTYFIHDPGFLFRAPGLSSLHFLPRRAIEHPEIFKFIYTHHQVYNRIAPMETRGVLAKMHDLKRLGKDKEISTLLALGDEGLLQTIAAYFAYTVSEGRQQDFFEMFRMTEIPSKAIFESGIQGGIRALLSGNVPNPFLILFNVFALLDSGRVSEFNQFLRIGSEDLETLLKDLVKRYLLSGGSASDFKLLVSHLNAFPEQVCKDAMYSVVNTFLSEDPLEARPFINSLMALEDSGSIHEARWLVDAGGHRLSLVLERYIAQVTLQDSLQGLEEIVDHKALFSEDVIRHGIESGLGRREGKAPEEIRDILSGLELKRPRRVEGMFSSFFDSVSEMLYSLGGAARTTSTSSINQAAGAEAKDLLRELGEPLLHIKL
jgi:hypothetical protein